MSVFVDTTYHCPHCRAEYTPLRIEQSEVVSCPSCGGSFRVSAAAFARTCGGVFALYGGLATLPVATLTALLVPWADATPGVRAGLGFFVLVIGTAVCGWAGYLYGMATAGGRDQRRPNRVRVVACLHCDTLNDPNETAGYCDNCGKKLPGVLVGR